MSMLSNKFEFRSSVLLPDLGPTYVAELEAVRTCVTCRMAMATTTAMTTTMTTTA